MVTPTMPKGGPGAWTTTPSDARDYSVSGQRKRTQEALEKVEELASQLNTQELKSITAHKIAAESIAETPREVKKEEPVRWVSAIVTLLSLGLVVCTAKGWVTFTTAEQTLLLNAIVVILNEVARMHVTAPSKQ